LGKGILHLVDNLFWNLPFASVKQGNAVREKFHVSQDDWDAKILEITAEHDLEGARQQLIDGWKLWIQSRHEQAGEGGAASMAGVNMSMIVVDE
jgi:hypothetical protein